METAIRGGDSVGAADSLFRIRRDWAITPGRERVCTRSPVYLSKLFSTACGYWLFSRARTRGAAGPLGARSR